MAYRTEVWMKLFGNLVLIVIQISIWKSLIGNGLVNGITLEEMITYSVITTANMNVLMLSAYTLLDEKLKMVVSVWTYKNQLVIHYNYFQIN